MSGRRGRKRPGNQNRNSGGLDYCGEKGDVRADLLRLHQRSRVNHHDYNNRMSLIVQTVEKYGKVFKRHGGMYILLTHYFLCKRLIRTLIRTLIRMLIH